MLQSNRSVYAGALILERTDKGKSIASRYGGGVFCNLPDGAVCMCSYSYQHEDSDFMIGNSVMLVVQRYDADKQQMYGKIVSKR